MKKNIFILLMFCCCSHLQAQMLNSYTGKALSANICESAGLLPNTKAQAIVDTLLDRLGFRQNIVVAECPDAGNCEAYMYNNVPYILVNATFLNKFGKLRFTLSSLPGTTSAASALPANTDWETLGVFCHEIGHLHNFHYATLNNDPNASIKKMELEADEYAGKLLHQLGATLQQAQAALYHPDVPEYDATTHPGRKTRLEAVKRGYEKEYGPQNVAPPPAVPAVNTDLAITAQTERGTRNLRYKEGETLQLFVSVNKPAYVRIVYELADNRLILLADDRRVSETEVNKLLEIGSGFSCEPPFGNEKLHVFAQTDPFTPLTTQPTSDGYTLIVDGLNDVYLKTRGFKKVKQYAENTLPITTCGK